MLFKSNSRLKGFYAIIFFSIVLMSCNFSGNNKEGKTNTKKTFVDSSYPIADTAINRRETVLNGIAFVSCSKEGLILPSSLFLMDTSFKKVREINTDKIIPIEIVAISKDRHGLVKNDDICEKANYVKIKYQGQMYIVFGGYVYEKVKKSVFKLTHQNTDYEIFPVTNFQLKAFVEGFGLTGCDGQSYLLLVIKRLKDNHYSLIKSQGKREPSTEKPVKYAVLLQTSYAEEIIEKASWESDTIVLGVKTTYQIAKGSYKLKIVYDENLSKCIMSDVVVRDNE